jgi:hypothetical protein
MSYISDPDGIIRRTIGLTEFKTDGEKHFKRKKGTAEWTEIVDQFLPETAELLLSLVRQTQSDGEPDHWLLFVALENEVGKAYQVKGDAQYMSYFPPSEKLNVKEDQTYKDSFQLATITEAQAKVVEEVAEIEPPPRASDRRSVTENCQGWTVRVIIRLVEKGIVSQAKLEIVKSLVEPINPT